MCSDIDIYVYQVKNKNITHKNVISYRFLEIDGLGQISSNVSYNHIFNCSFMYNLSLDTNIYLSPSNVTNLS